MTTIIPVILSGGAGSRLWPLSRKDYPKQLLPLLSDKTLLQETALRFKNDSRYAAPVVICNEAHRFAIAEQLQQVGVKASIILEPEGKNTAPAAAIAALRQLETDSDSLLLLVSSDHVILQPKAFHTAVEQAAAAARMGYLVTFGIKPTAAETGYGYIQRGVAVEGTETFTIEKFIEKPPLADAERYAANSAFSWNAGLFLFSAQTFIDELRSLQPAMLESCQKALAASATDLDFVRLDRETFACIKGESIDYAVMEHTRKAAVVPVADMGWSDIGSWKALWEVSDNKDSNGNVCIGDVLTERSSGNYVRSHDKQLVTLAGIHDAVVVVTEDAVLVAHKDQAQRVKQLVESLQQDGRRETIHHRRVFRPWGSYESVDEGERYQVKRIVVKPGQKLSLQKHFHRAEHWVIVKGTAIVTRDGEQLTLQENESVYLPLACVHRLENPGRIPLVLVEVQSGSYLGEDDIVRLEDTYGRTS